MHPAPSVILFTVLSGQGFGLLFFLGLGLPSVSGRTAAVFYGLAFGLAIGGLIASTFHLGHPERAWRALSQWRSSWLSREGCAALASLTVMAIYAYAAIALSHPWPLLGLLGACLALSTVFATAMIYTQLRTIPRWHLPWTPALFVSFALTGGALLAGKIHIATILLPITAALQMAYWHFGDRAFDRSKTSLATATGLGTIGHVQAFEPPHTGSNYLLQEFVYVIGRRHRRKLRILAMLLAFVLPFVALQLPLTDLLWKHLVAGLAVLTHSFGAILSRWLFFAEAEHVVGLYYGKR